MADNEYEITKNNFNIILGKLIGVLNKAELLWALDSCKFPSDVRKTLINRIAEKLMGGVLNDAELMTVALSPASVNNEAAKKILDNNPDSRQLGMLLRLGHDFLSPEIIERAGKMLDDRIFAGCEKTQDMVNQ